MNIHASNSNKILNTRETEESSQHEREYSMAMKNDDRGKMSIKLEVDTTQQQSRELRTRRRESESEAKIFGASFFHDDVDFPLLCCCCFFSILQRGSSTECVYMEKQLRIFVPTRKMNEWENVCCLSHSHCCNVFFFLFGCGIK